MYTFHLKKNLRSIRLLITEWQPIKEPQWALKGARHCLQKEEIPSKVDPQKSTPKSRPLQKSTPQKSTPRRVHIKNTKTFWNRTSGRRVMVSWNGRQIGSQSTILAFWHRFRFLRKSFSISCYAKSEIWGSVPLWALISRWPEVGLIYFFFKPQVNHQGYPVSPFLDSPHAQCKSYRPCAFFAEKKRINPVST